MSPMMSVCAAVLVAASLASASYPTRYDNVDLDKVLTNDRLRKNAVNCLLTNVGCTPEVIELKTYIPDALQTGCASCTERQKEGTQKTFKFLLDFHPEDYKALAAKYDPTNQYAQRYRQEAAKHGIHV